MGNPLRRYNAKPAHRARPFHCPAPRHEHGSRPPAPRTARAPPRIPGRATHRRRRLARRATARPAVLEQDSRPNAATSPVTGRWMAKSRCTPGNCSCRLAALIACRCWSTTARCASRPGVPGMRWPPIVSASPNPMSHGFDPARAGRWRSSSCRWSASTPTARAWAWAAAGTIAASPSVAQQPHTPPWLVGAGFALQRVDALDAQAWDVRAGCHLHRATTSSTTPEPSR